MDSRKIVERTSEWVKNRLVNENTGHDWIHARAVMRNARQIAKNEVGVNRLIVDLAALLHDVGDWKLSDLPDDERQLDIENWLREMSLDEKLIKEIINIIKNISYLGPKSIEEELTIEGQIVRDADRLEVLGKNAWERMIKFTQTNQIPTINEYLPNLNLSIAEYKDFKRKENSSINHVFEKLLLVHKRIITKKGKEMALRRHEELKNTVRKYLESIRKTGIVSESRIEEYIQMLEEPRFN